MKMKPSHRNGLKDARRGMLVQRRIPGVGRGSPASPSKALRNTAINESRPEPSAGVSGKQILVPVDFSDCSRAVLGRAIWLARLLKADLTLLYVAETSPAGAELGENHSWQFEADLRRLAGEQLRRLKGEIPDEIAGRVIIRAGRADAEIIEAARLLKADLIVMATHSHCSQAGQLGTTASRVTCAARCPVLLVPVHELNVPFFI